MYRFMEVIEMSYKTEVCIALQEGAVAGDCFSSTMRHEPSILFMQLLTYMRMSRLQDPALFSKIVFEKDMMLDQVSRFLSMKRISFWIQFFILL